MKVLEEKIEIAIELKKDNDILSFKNDLTLKFV